MGWPIVPGFDVAGVVEAAGADSGFAAGDAVYGCTLFGAYSTRVLIPSRQLQPKPRGLAFEDAAALPAVAGTALHALALAGFWAAPPPPRPPHPSSSSSPPSPPTSPSLTRNRAVLIHSAAGGVGSMLVQMSKLLGCSPVVAVVGSSHKVAHCRALGADAVIDKSAFKATGGDASVELWAAVAAAAPAAFSGKYGAVFDANGVSTLRRSFDALDRCGRLVVYGFHSNLPRGVHLLDPFAWLKMAIGVARMPSFDPMEMVLESKAVLGFNLSFFADETAVIKAYLRQINDWVTAGKIQVGKVTVFDSMAEVGKAHQLIQSGNSVGKIVVRACAAAAAAAAEDDVDGPAAAAAATQGSSSEAATSAKKSA